MWLDLANARRLGRGHPGILLAPEEHQRAVVVAQEVARRHLRARTRQRELVKGFDGARVLRGEIDRTHQVIVDVVLVHLV